MFFLLTLLKGCGLLQKSWLLTTWWTQHSLPQFLTKNQMTNRRSQRPRFTSGWEEAASWMEAQRVRTGIRRLRRQFGHVPMHTMLQLLRASRVAPEFLQACKLHRCVACESTARKKPTHKVILPTEYRFRHISELIYWKFGAIRVISTKCWTWFFIGATFQLVAVVKKVSGQCSSAECLRILSEGWCSWAGLPEQITCDRRGLHNRSTFYQIC